MRLLKDGLVILLRITGCEILLCKQLDYKAMNALPDECLLSLLNRLTHADSYRIILASTSRVRFAAPIPDSVRIAKFSRTKIYFRSRGMYETFEHSQSKTRTFRADSKKIRETWLALSFDNSHSNAIYQNLCFLM